MLPFSPITRQTLGVVPLQIFNQCFADQATEIPGITGVARVHERAKLDGMLGGIGRLKNADLSSPEGCGFADTAELLPQFVDGDAVISIDQDVAEQMSAGASPVFERMVEKIGERHNEAAEIPKADHHIHGADFFDPSPLPFESRIDCEQQIATLIKLDSDRITRISEPKCRGSSVKGNLASAARRLSRTSD